MKTIYYLILYYLILSYRPQFNHYTCIFIIFTVCEVCKLFAIFWEFENIKNDMSWSVIVRPFKLLTTYIHEKTITLLTENIHYNDEKKPWPRTLSLYTSLKCQPMMIFSTDTITIKFSRWNVDSFIAVNRRPYPNLFFRSPTALWEIIR